MVKNNARNITKTVLVFLAMGGIITLLAVAPGAAMAFKLFMPQRRKKINLSQWQLRNTIKRLKKQKEIKFLSKNNQTILILTEKGKKHIFKYNLDEMKLEKPKKWDRKWRLIIFDIPENKRKGRDCLRQKLRDLGFYQLQKSVFVCPYECKNEIIFLREFFNIEKYINYIIANSIENEFIIKKFFDLP